MKNDIWKKCIYYSTGVIYIAIASFIYNFSVNGHYHTNPNGHLIYHFHPFNQSDDAQNKHTHSSTEFTCIDNYNNSNLFYISLFKLLPKKSECIILEIKSNNEHFHFHHLFADYSLRAPPLENNI